ncbi:hypothetical protein DIS24_g7547 [Lasiodiplodia hormozganensis]|uniref:Uncharacterized protein n=1 Tax=Lasiodiplodia hormozganensis TaxID=869390 RepID=A0AA39Y7V6_9PEZI|nr:hypothetical protein DIS24_g7547 [Lasiodiplodia hormozganensis]
MTPPSDEPVYNLTLQHSDLSDDRIPIPARFSVERLPEDSQQWHKPPPTPLSLSFFDNLIHAYTYQGHPTTSDQRSATDVIRKLLLSSWQGVIRSKEIDYYYLWSKTSFSKAHYISGSSWYSAWQREYFHALTYHMMTVMNRMKDIDDIFRTLYSTTTASSFTLPPLPNGDSPHLNHNSSSSKNQNNTDDRERQSWHALRSRAHALHARFAATLATYEQRAAIEQSVLANEQSVLSNKQSMLANEQSVLANNQARSVGRLSALATVLVPFSVVAGIFSMSGRFAAGEDLFWVFWILAVSFSGGFVGWLFFERVVRALGSVMDWCGLLWGRRRGKGKTKGQGAVLPVHEKDT